MPKETILIVEDNVDMLLLLKDSLLVPMGYNVITAPNGQRGLEMALEHLPDLILLDMNMPKMTGLEMLIALRQTTCDAPVIFMTVENSLRVAVEAFRLGVVDYLSKPFSLEDGERAINRALAQKRLQAEYDQMAKDLIKAETIRQTIITLSHYLNNDLMCIEHNLNYLQEKLNGRGGESGEKFDDCLECLDRIKAVMKVLGKVTTVKHTSYDQESAMIDIEAALAKMLPSQGKQPSNLSF